MCPRKCGVNRLEGKHLGECRTGAHAVVSSSFAHFGEEAPLVGRHGSGTIFFSWCNLHCQFCQNCELSAGGEGREVGASVIAAMMLELQAVKCHNINFVSPSHVVPQILEALCIAVEEGLRLPLVYNTGGYDAIETLLLLDGIVDIYMPDMKYANGAIAEKYSSAQDYPEVNQAAVREMHRQVGDLEVDAQGVAQRGLLVRHLVLPEDLAGTKEICYFIAAEISENTYINLMDQYRPCHKASDWPELSRRISQEEYERALDAAREAGLRRLDNGRKHMSFL